MPKDPRLYFHSLGRCQSATTQAQVDPSDGIPAPDLCPDDDVSGPIPSLQAQIKLKK